MWIVNGKKINVFFIANLLVELKHFGYHEMDKGVNRRTPVLMKFRMTRENHTEVMEYTVVNP